MKTGCVQSNDFTGAFRVVPAAVTIVATMNCGLRYGMTATAVAPVSADPPQILVAINKSTRCGSAIARSGVFSINFLAADDRELARLFSQPGADPQSRFLAGEWTQAVTGSPMLVGALASFDCDLVDRHSHGTHYVLIGRVAAIARHEAPPLLYLSGAYRAAPIQSPLG
jgi:flavin reductase